MELLTTFFSFIQSLFHMAFGLVIAGGLLYFIYYQMAFRWRYLAGAYAREWGKPFRVKHMQSVVLYGLRPAANTHRGIVTIGIEERGVAFKPVWWLAPFHEPLFIPYEDIKGWNERWFIDDKSVELEFKKAPDVKLLMAASEFQWIRDFAGNQVDISDEMSPNNAHPTFFYGLSIIMGFVGLTVAIFLIGSMLGFWTVPVHAQ